MEVRLIARGNSQGSPSARRSEPLFGRLVTMQPQNITSRGTMEDGRKNR